MAHSLKKGQNVWVVTSNNRGHEDLITEGKIIGIGRKYFTIDAFNGDKFFIETLKIDAGGYTSHTKVYLDIQVYYDEKEKQLILSFISESFSWHSKQKLSLDKLRQIKQIIESE